MKRNADTQAFGVRAFVMTGAFALLILVGGLGSWIGFARLSGAVILPGEIRLTQSNRPIAHPQGGRLSAVLVREGDRVKAGQILVRLETADIRSELAIVTARLMEYRTTRARLISERDGLDAVSFPHDLLAEATANRSIAEVLEGQRSLFAVRQKAKLQSAALLEQQAARLAAQADGLKSQLAALVAERKLLQTQFKNQKDQVARGLLPANTTRFLEQDLAELEGQTGARRAQLNEAQLHLGELRLERLRRATREREEIIAQLRELEFRQNEMAERHRALSARVDAMAIRAPVAGTVLGASGLGEGMVVQPGATLMHIVPAGQKFTVLSRVGPTRIDQLYRGQPVDIRLATAGADFGAGLGALSNIFRPIPWLTAAASIGIILFGSL